MKCPSHDGQVIERGISWHIWITLMSTLSCLAFSYTKGDLDFTYVTSRIIGKFLVFINSSAFSCCSLQQHTHLTDILSL